MFRLDDYWYSRNLLAFLLLPLSWLFCSVAMIRRRLYRAGFLKSYKLPVPVIIVGNISVGGTGKTPLLIALCELLKQQGISVGIVSRGYGGNFSGVKIVSHDDQAASVGDEPCLLKRRTGVPVVVGANRPLAGQLLLDKQSCDLVLSDDGLQHYRLQRDLEIAVVDAKRGFGNGFCLPAGPLRERVRRLQDVDIVVSHISGNLAVEQANSFTLEFDQAVNLLTEETRTVESFRGSRVHAVAGIGHPSRFFDQLRRAGLALVEHAYPDHYAYSPTDLTFDDDSIVLMTEKDAVKCTTFANDKVWYIPVTARLSGQLSDRFMSEVSRLLGTGSGA